MRNPLQFRGVGDLHQPAVHGDHAVLLQAGEPAAYRLQRKAEESRDVLAAHRQLEGVRGRADRPVTLGKPVQEQRDALVGLPAHEDLAVVGIAVDAMPDDPQQLLLQARHLRGDVGQVGERNLADVGGGQRHGFAAMAAVAKRIEPDEFAGQVETEDLLLPVLAGTDGLEGAVARDVHRLHRIAGAKQALATFHRAATADDVVQARQIARTDAGRKTQLLKRAMAAALAQPGEVARDGSGHRAMFSRPALCCRQQRAGPGMSLS